MATVMTSIHGTAERLKAEGYGVSEYVLTQWVDTGQLPYVRAGRNRLLNWNVVLKHLEGKPARVRK